MTNRIALFLGAVVVALVILDAVVFGAANLLFLAKKFYDFLDWIAFWR